MGQNKDGGRQQIMATCNVWPIRTVFFWICRVDTDLYFIFIITFKKINLCFLIRISKSMCRSITNIAETKSYIIKGGKKLHPEFLLYCTF